MLRELPVGVWVGRVPDGRVAYANDAFQEILGRAADPDALIGAAPAVYSLCDHDGRPYPAERLPFSRVLAEDRAVEVDDIVIHRADGRRVPVRALARPIRDTDGRITHVSIAFTDISDEIRLIHERNQLAHNLSFALEHAPVALFSIDRQGTITMSEGAGLAALGVRPGALVGLSVFELYKDHPTVPGYIRRGLAGDSFMYTVEVPGAAGTVVFDTWLTPTRDAEGGVTGVIGICTDVTEIRKLQARAMQDDRIRAMGTLAAGIAHEINNPLTYLMSNLEMTRRELGAALAGREAPPAGSPLQVRLSRLQALLEPMALGAERIATVIRDLRGFARPDDQRVSLLDVRTVLRSVLQLLGKEIEARAQLAVDLAREVAPLRANEARLVQVFVNLLVNAWQALPPRPVSENRIEVRAFDEGNRVVVEIADNGAGVPPQDRLRIFEPFVTTKAVGEGTGLGLFVSRNIVRELGGDIEVDERPGGGARFRVALPARGGAGPVDHSVTPPPQARPRDRSRVLLVDDDEMVARSLAAQLSHGGFDPLIARDPRDAVSRLVDDDSIALCYCDLMMRGFPGMRVYEEVRAKAPRRAERIVFMTGGAFTEEAQRFIASRPGSCVEKPFAVVADALRRTRP